MTVLFALFPLKSYASIKGGLESRGFHLRTYSEADIHVNLYDFSLINHEKSLVQFKFYLNQIILS